MRASWGSAAPVSRAAAATAETVRGLSPEMILSATFCSAKYRKVAPASGRTRSENTTRPAGTSPGGRVGAAPSLRRADPRASATTLRPSAASRPASARVWSEVLRCASTISGAPSTHVPWPAKLAPLHLRAEEKATLTSAFQPSPSGGGQAAATASRVAFLLVAAAASAPSASGRLSAPDSETVEASTAGSTSSRVMAPSVMVPVLSQQRMSTRARPSTAWSSWTRTRLRASRTTERAMAVLASSTSPSGTMPTTPATEPRTASTTPIRARSWPANRITAVGTRAQVT